RWGECRQGPMAPDPRTPVLVGVGQWSNRVDRGEPAVEPVDMMAEALRRAAEDSGAGLRALERADAVRVSRSLSRSYRNAARLVAERLGAAPRDEAVTPAGGNEPQGLGAQAGRHVAAGDADVGLICGAEAWRTRSVPPRDRREDLGWTKQDDTVPPARQTAPDFRLNHPAEIARQVFAPSQVYALFEHALRAAAERPIDEHLVRISELWARFTP